MQRDGCFRLASAPRNQGRLDTFNVEMIMDRELGEFFTYLVWCRGRIQRSVWVVVEPLHQCAARILEGGSSLTSPPPIHSKIGGSKLEHFPTQTIF